MRNEAVMADRKDTACRLLKKGRMSLEEIAEISKLSIEEVRVLDARKARPFQAPLRWYAFKFLNSGISA